MAGIKDVSIKTITSLPKPTFHYDYPQLTTTFTYAYPCGKQWLQLFPDEDGGSSSSYFSITQYGTFFRACQPENAVSFSPGLCPSGQRVAAMTESIYKGDLKNRLWEAVCCVEGFDLNSRGLCQATVYSTSFDAFRPETLNIMYGDSVVSSRINYDPNDNTTKVEAGTLFADALHIYWEASDLSIFDPSDASALASKLKLDFTPTSSPRITQTALTKRALASGTPRPTPAASGYDMPTPRPTPIASGYDIPTSAPASSSGLSKAATVGISIGAAFGGAAVAIAIFLIYKRIRHRKQTPPPEETTRFIELPELQDPDRKEPHGAELETRLINELASPTAELDGGDVWKEGRDRHLK